MNIITPEQASKVVGGSFTAKCAKGSPTSNGSGYNWVHKNVSVGKKKDKKAEKACNSLGTGWHFNGWK